MLMNRRGFGLIEVMVSVAIMSIIMVGATQMITDLNNNVKEVRTLSNRDHIAQLVRHYSANTEALRASAINSGPNSELTRCVLGTGTGTCTNLGAPREFTLRDTQNTISIAGRETGLPQLYYSRDGTQCAPVGVECPIQSSTWYVPVCYPGGCAPTAAYINIYYRVRRAPAVTSRLFFRTACTSHPTFAPLTPANCAAGTPPISVSLPLFGTTGGLANRVPFWDTTLSLAPSNIEVITATPGGNIRINNILPIDAANPATANCDPVNNNGALRTNNGALEICQGSSSTWRHVGGLMNSNTAVNAGVGLPYLTNLYVCPAGGNATRCGREPVCMGQVTRRPYAAAGNIAPLTAVADPGCCMDRRVYYRHGAPTISTDEAPFFPPPAVGAGGPPLPTAYNIQGSNVNAPCLPLF